MFKRYFYLALAIICSGLIWYYVIFVPNKLKSLKEIITVKDTVTTQVNEVKKEVVWQVKKRIEDVKVNDDNCSADCFKQL